MHGMHLASKRVLAISCKSQRNLPQSCRKFILNHFDPDRSGRYTLVLNKQKFIDLTLPHSSFPYRNLTFMSHFLNISVHVTCVTSTTIQASTNSPNNNGQDVTSSSDNSNIQCYACGLEEIDPEKDLAGSYGDGRREDVKGITPKKKMYNHTCDIAAEMGFDERWVRNCPAGVRSCFWAEARYDKQGKI